MNLHMNKTKENFIIKPNSDLSLAATPYPKKIPKFSSHYKFGQSHACIFITFGSWQIENLGLLDLALPSKFQDFFSIWTYFILDLGPTGLTGHIYSYDKVPFLL